MRQGEWLLAYHVNHVRQLEVIQTRCMQCRDFLYNPDEEQMLMKLESNARIIQDYINVFDLVVSALSDDDKWFVETHFVKRTSITAMCEMEFPNGRILSKTTIHNIKNRIIAEVSDLCVLLNFYPHDLPPDSQQLMEA